jgi:hypothetical protein
MNLTKDLQKLSKKTIIDPIFEELAEQHYAANSHRFFQSLRKNQTNELFNLSKPNQPVKA